MNYLGYPKSMLQFATYILILESTLALIREISMPDMLENCFRKFASQTSVKSTVGEAIGFYCNQQYSWRHSAINNLMKFNMTHSQYVWYNSLMPTPKRHRNTSGYKWKSDIRVRKEIRAMSNRERHDYNRAIQLMKADTSVPPNKYDAFAALHQGMATSSAHGGPNFVGWHRFYITMFENALREQVPGVAVPYWASTLDSKMADPTKSIVWSELFFGNGVGLVRTGPFADWMTASGPLIRNIGDSGGFPFRENDIKSILSRTRMSEILEPTALPPNNLEFFHGRVHDYIDGQMAQLATSSQDPVFFAHHAYVDFVWEVFRMQQRKYGINPELDYPEIVNSSLHEASAPLGFGTYRNIDSYSDEFIDGLFTYDPVPTCTSEKRDCGSPWLRCEVSSGMSYCVSSDSSVLPSQPPQKGTKVQNSRNNVANNQRQTLSSMRMSSNVETFPNNVDSMLNTVPNHQQNSIQMMNLMKKGIASSDLTSMVTTMKPPHHQVSWHNLSSIIKMNRRMQQMAQHGTQNTRMGFQHRFSGGMTPNFKPRELFMTMNGTQQTHRQQTPEVPIPRGQCPAIPISQGYQNTFNINGMSDISQWVYIPVKIVYRRPPNYKKYTAYPIRKNVVSYVQDIYSPMGYTMLKNRFSTSDLATYPTCNNKKGASGSVFVQSSGINYLGTYKEYAVVDHRLAISMSTTYVAIRNPIYGHSDAMITAFDTCGRICVPFCQVPGSPNGATRACSGAIRVTSDAPKMYGANYGEAVMDTWTLSGGRHCPSLDNNHVFISFYCDYEEAWPFVGTEAPAVQPSQVMMPIPVVPVATHVVAMVTCDLGHGCKINDYCNSCRTGEIRRCEGTCSLYVVCQSGTYHLQRCHSQTRFDARYGKCVMHQGAHCPEEELPTGRHKSSKVDA